VSSSKFGAYINVLAEPALQLILRRWHVLNTGNLLMRLGI
jgi:hypothetical protein